MELTENQLRLLQEIDIMEGHGLLRIFLTKEDIKDCNILVKKGLLLKGKPDHKNATIAFFITDLGKNSIT